MRFSKELWFGIQKIYRAILQHEFIKGLVSGDLEEDKFQFYVIQDALYLREFSKVLSLAAAKAPKDEWLVTFNEQAKIAILVERELHESFFKYWGLNREEVYSKPISPTNLAYTSYLLHIAYSKPFHEILGALLPCYWIYWEIGKELSKKGSKKEIYQRWINTYSAEDFSKVCIGVIDMLDELAKDMSLKDKALVRDHFITSSRYEFLFFDSAYKKEEWLI
mgnify:CR=1 FL=1